MTLRTHVPLPYRLIFLYIEPFAAFFGVYITLTHPFAYLQSLSPLATPDTFSPLD